MKSKAAAVAQELPYLHVVDMPRRMGGVGAPKQMVFGVLGHTMMSSENKVLGGLVRESTKGVPIPAHMKEARASKNTDHHIIGPKSKTHIPGDHMGQVPYAGAFMSHLGGRL